MTCALPTLLHEDNHLLVVVKPPAVPTQGDSTGALALNERLKAYLKEQYGKPGAAFLGIVHRLDRPVGGVMVFAKTSKAAGRLSEEIRSRRFGKRYLAVVRGRPPSGKQRRIDHLRKNRRSNRVAVVAEGTPGAKRAELSFRVLSSAEGCALLMIELHTGRPHQIRVQLAQVGHPLLGDRKYGPREARCDTGLALWSYRLSFTHPTRREPLSFAHPPPDGAPWSRFQDRIRRLDE